MTERLARFCARRPILIGAIWAVLALIAGVLAVDGEVVPGRWHPTDFLDTAITTELRLGGGFESSRADALLEDRLRGPKPIIETVIAQSGSLTVDAPEFRQRVESLHDEIVSLGADTVTGARNYYHENDPSLVSVDRKTTIMQVVMTGRLGEAAANVEEVLHIVEQADAMSDFRALMVGPASISFETTEIAREDLEKGERFGVPIALIVLIVLLGAVVAVLIPMGMSINAIIVALGIAALIGQVYELVNTVTVMIAMIGLAVGIDYSLLIVSRFRTEMGRGISTHEAVVRASATAGHTVLFSGITVVIALCGMLIVPISVFKSLGIGAILVVIVALAATLTLLPAMLTKLGPKVNMLRVPFFGKDMGTPEASKATDVQQRGFWGFTTRIVTRLPIVSLLVVGVPMIVVASFYLNIRTGLNGVDVFPEGTQTREAFFVMEEEFSFGLVDPVEVVIDGDINNPRIQQAIQALETSLRDDPSYATDPVRAVNDAGDLTLLAVAIAGEPGSPAAIDAMSRLRDQYILDAFVGVQAEVLVGGASAQRAELLDTVDKYTPIVFVFVLGCSFIILMLVFQSIVIPVKAVIMNLLSVGVVYGLLVLVFQKGVGTELLGFQHTEVIDAWIPIFLFSILFGLSMDYHVFLLSAIRERYDQTGNNDEAVAYGLRSTTGIITGAALIMVVVFGAFAAGESVLNQQIGFGLAVAILLDATLVRSVLVPASMVILGRRNWYLPHWLSWLPDLRVEPKEDRYPSSRSE